MVGGCCQLPKYPSILVADPVSVDFLGEGGGREREGRGKVEGIYLFIIDVWFCTFLMGWVGGWKL